ETVATVRARLLSESLFDAAAIRRLAEVLAASGKETDRRAGLRLDAYLTAQSDEARQAGWLGLFNTAAGEPRKTGSMVTNAARALWPELSGRLAAESERLTRLGERMRAAECFATTAAMLHLADAAISEYERQKARRGALDFEDLIVKTAGLLSRSQAARWVQYKLDRGLDHILVDEAQDTSPRQWQVIRAIAGDFFAGEGSSAAARTIFAVGDEKQSI